MSFVPRSATLEQRATAPAVARAPVRAYDVGLLLLRIATGFTMIAHGTQKLFGWFAGHGLEATAGFLTKAGYPAGHAFAIVTGLAESLGGLSLLLGLLTPLGAAALIGVMINAVAVGWTGFNGKTFFGMDGADFPLLVALAAAAIAFTGPGAISLDRFIPALQGHRIAYGVGAVVLGVVTGVIVLLLRS